MFDIMVLMKNLKQKIAQPNDIKVFWSKETKGPKQNNQTRLGSTL